MDTASCPTVINGPAGRPLRAGVIGCGGTGCNILAEGGLDAVAMRIAIGTAPETMASLKVDRKMMADAGMLEKDAAIAGKAVRLAGSGFESELASALGSLDVVFVFAGLGGLSGGWGAVLGARASSVARGLSVCVVSLPFSVESGSRRDRAVQQLGRLTEQADCVIAVPNDMILSEAPNIPFNKAFHVMNMVLASPANLFLRSFGNDDAPSLRKHLAGTKLLSMDSAEWDRENADFAVVEKLSRSRWLDLANRKPGAAMLFVEGASLHGDLEELGRLFSRAAGKDCKVLVAGSGERKGGLRVTAVVGC